MIIEERIALGGPMNEADGDYGYLSGFGNTHSTQAELGALPIGRNSPQQPPLGLYAEQLSGTAFTAPRAENKRSWLYRILPSVKHGTGFAEVDVGDWRTAPCTESKLPAMQLRWQPTEIPTTGEVDFLAGVKHYNLRQRKCDRGHRVSCLCCERVDGPEVFPQRGWRNAVCSAGKKKWYPSGD